MKILKKIHNIINGTIEVFVHSIRLITGPIRVLPDFLIVGAQKAGTTSLYNYLVSHPSIIPSFRKEVRYFDSNFKKGLVWYRSYFPTKIYKYFMEKFCHRDFVTGEASPYYILHPHVAKRVYSQLPHIKIIMLLRNPVNRSFSQYFHTLKSGREKFTFEEAIKKEDERTKDEYNKILKDEFYRSSRFPAFAYLTRSIYLKQIRIWFKYFNKEQILIIRSEDLFDNPKEVVKNVINFLNLPKWSHIEYRKYHSDAKGKKMNEKTMQNLKEFFEPHNKELYEYLERDFNWD